MYLFWAFQNEIWNEVAMKLRFSRIAEQRKCSISFVTSGNLAGKREAVHFVPNPWDFWRKWNLGSDLRWIPHWTHLCGAFGRLPPTHPSTKMQWDFKGVESQMVASATWGCLAWGVETIHKSRGCSCNEGWERAWEKVNAQILGKNRFFSELSVNMKWCIKTVENVMYVMYWMLKSEVIFKGRSVLKQGCKEKSGKFQCRGEYSFNTLVRSCRTGILWVCLSCFK